MKIPDETREAVKRRARNACEYCRLPQSASILPHQVDHIVARQHHGADDVENRCLCCLRCNLKKGPNLASIELGTDHLVPLFHPRRQKWRDHFSLNTDGKLQGRTPEGRVTVQLLEMNDADRVALRVLLLRRGRHS